VCTICEHLDWVTPTGRYKEKSCASALRRLEALGLAAERVLSAAADSVVAGRVYANGPVPELCRRYHWQFMIVLRDESLSTVWEEFGGLGQLERQNHLERNWGNRKQRFRWVNWIERYGERERKKQILHVVVCEESWEAIDGDSPAVVQKTARHAWISSVLVSRENVHERCNLGARHRWGIEEGILLEKHHGYGYEHGFLTTGRPCGAITCSRKSRIC